MSIFQCDIPIEKYSGSCPSDSEILQSEWWQAVQESDGKKTHRISGILFLEQTIPFIGAYWYAPRGPILSSEAIWGTVKKRAQERNVHWIRIEPRKDVILDEAVAQFGKNHIKRTYDVQPRQTFCIDIGDFEEDILARMKPKTRYNIRLAEKKGTRFFATQDATYLDRFYELVQETSRRAGIHPHPKEHYKNLFDVLLTRGASLYCAEFDGSIIAANFVVFYKTCAVYMHGASSEKHHRLMAPYGLQWRAIQDAKKRGCRWYDFGGVDIADSSGKWAGITRFKTGFNPHIGPIEFPGTYDIVLSPLRYRFCVFARFLKRFS